MNAGSDQRKGIPFTFFAGVAVIAVCEALLFVDVTARGWARVPEAWPLPEPTSMLQAVGRWVSANMTPLCWMGYLLLFEGLTTWIARRRGELAIASIRARPNRFLIAWLTSIPVWCFFDYVNFYHMDAWRYHGLPDEAIGRYIGYFIAFAAISPGMFLAAQVAQHLGCRRMRSDGERRNLAWAWGITIGMSVALTMSVLGMFLVHPPLLENVRLTPTATAVMLLGPGLAVMAATRSLPWTMAAFGGGMVVWAIAIGNGVGNMTLWVGLVFLLDPINAWAGAPSILRDWRAGRWGRTVSLMIGGAVCGFCWEFWNYWAVAKWTYHLPFLGPLEQYRYFEMPWVGFQGFLPFAVECWVMLNTILMLARAAGLQLAEPLPDEDAVM